MEFSSDILTGLGYLANGSHFTDENFKKIVNSSLGLLAGVQNIDRVPTICPEKGDIVRKSYTSLLTFTLEVLKFSAEDDIKNILMKQNLRSDRVDYYMKNLNVYKDSIVEGLKNCSTTWPNLIDVNWRLDFVVKTNVQNHLAEPVYFVILSTAKEGKVEHIKFTCDLHQLQDLCTKLKEIMEFKTEICDLWNLSGVRAPPLCTAKTICRQSVILDIRDVLSDVNSTHNSLKVFKVEAAFLERFLYRFKRLFRQDKGIQQLTKVKQALKRLRAYNAIASIKRFGRCFPQKIPPDGSEAHLPTRQLLKWGLLRLLSNAKLFLRIIDLCKDAGRFIYGRLSIGWSAANMTFALAVNSRILTFAKYMLIKTIEWYDRLQIHLPHLIETVDLFHGYEFPKKMEDFIGYVDLRPPTKKAEIDKIFELIDLTRGDENEEDDDIILMNEIINTVDSDNEVEITNEYVIVEEEKSRSKGIKRLRDDDDDELAVLYQQTKRSAPILAPLKRVEDLGEPVRKKKLPKRHKSQPGRGTR